jgi:hypothetical protein
MFELPPLFGLATGGSRILTSSAPCSQEAFRKGDILRVQLQTRQWLEGAELKAEHAIVKVLQHESGPEQQNLVLPHRNGEDGER